MGCMMNTKINNITDDTILDCGHKPSPHGPYTTGYAYNVTDDKTLCYDCAAKIEHQYMLDNNKTVLYLVRNTSELNPFYEVTDWPGKLRFRVRHMKTGRYNLARKAYHVWFTGPNNTNWHGVTYGDNTQLCHCKRIKG
jgi:hypothetical protein